MDYGLQLQKGGILAVKEWDSEFNDFVEQPLEDEEIGFYLYDKICFERGIRLRDLFLLISKNIYMFSVALGCPFLDDLVEEALSTPKKNEEKDGMAALVLKWISLIDGDQNDRFLQSHLSFHGTGTKDFAVEFSPINELAIYPVMLDESFTVMDKKEVLLQTVKTFSLLEVLKGIIDELSYMGPPDIKKFVLQDMKKCVDDTSFNLVTTEDIEKKLNEKIAETERPCRICKKEARSPDFNKPPDICITCYNKIREN